MNETKLIWRERTSKSDFITSVWYCNALLATTHRVLADACISLVLVKVKDEVRVVLRGPQTQPYNEFLEAGYECVAIRLQPGAFIRGFSAQGFINSSLALPADTEARFWFEGAHLKFPDFDNVELLIDQLHALGYLQYEMPDDVKALSARSYSRFVKRTTGLSPYRLRQLQRTHQALRLLKQGMPSTMVAAELEFADESHLIRVLKQFLGYTPKQLRYVPQTP
jgi:AraC-like DNA-binding protein